MVKMSFFVPEYHEKYIRSISKKNMIPMSRLIAFALDNEIERDTPFEYNLEMPECEFDELANAEEAGKILDFMKGLHAEKGVGLESIMLYRFKIGIPCKKKLMLGFRELYFSEMIESFKPKQRKGFPELHPDYEQWRVKASQRTKSSKAMANKAKRYEQFLKLQKEFKEEEQ